MFNFLPWFIKLLEVNSREDAEEYCRDLEVELEEYNVYDTYEDEFLCSCFEEGLICTDHVGALINSIRGRLLSLELLGSPLDILGNLDNLDEEHCPSYKLFIRFPEADLLSRYGRKRTPAFVLEAAARSGHVDLCREVLEPGLSSTKSLQLYAPPSEDMKSLLDSYGISVEISRDPEETSFDFSRKLVRLITFYDEEDEDRSHYNYDHKYYRILLNTLKNPDTDYRMGILKSITRHKELFYINIFEFYFVDGLENARNYFPDKF